MNENDIFIAVISTTLIIIVLVAAIVIYSVVATRERLKQQMKISQLALDYQKELRLAESEVSEKTMEYIARELHDNIGHTLVLIRLQIENKKISAPETVPIFEPVEGLLSESFDQLRMLSRSMNRDYVGDNNLKELLAHEVHRVQKAGKPDIILIEGSQVYPENKNRDLMIFRITQELISNALKHSGADRIEISIYQDDYMLKVKDNGRGFNAEKMLASPKASGLRNIQKRANLAGLKFLYNVSENNGFEGILKFSHVPEMHDVVA